MYVVCDVFSYPLLLKFSLCVSLQMRQRRELPRQVRQIRHTRQLRAIRMNGSSLSGIIGQRKTLFERRGTALEIMPARYAVRISRAWNCKFNCSVNETRLIQTLIPVRRCYLYNGDTQSRGNN